jgi:uracil phosphoribosyltransferase
MDRQYQQSDLSMNEREHGYGEQVHILNDPYLLTLSAQLSDPATGQPQFNEIVVAMYRALFRETANHFLRSKHRRQKTRLHADHPQAVIEAPLIDPNQKVVLVDLTRAGIVPAMVGLDFYSRLLAPSGVRVDHIYIGRTVDPQTQVVTGASIVGSKIGGSLDDAVMVIPDPMCATGASVLQTLAHYRARKCGKPRAIVCLHLICAPEGIRAIT